MSMRDIDSQLLQSALSEDMVGVEAALRAGADPNAPDEDGVTVLGRSVRCSMIVVMRLIQAGGDPNIPDAEGLTPLMRAIDVYMPANIQAMIDAGGNLSFQAVAEESWTALHVAVDADNHDNTVKRTQFVLARLQTADLMMLWDQQKVTAAAMAAQFDLRRDRAERQMSAAFRSFFDKQFEALTQAREAARQAPAALEKQKRESRSQAQEQLRKQAGKVRVRFKP